jgi:ADP-ribosyl-[dinitrogen reductase] hydrolase
MPSVLEAKNKASPKLAKSPILLDRAQGAYVGLAVGDALGATVEFMTPAEIREQYGVHRTIVGGGWLKLRKGHVTDDTSMSIFLGRSIIDKTAIDAVAIAESFSDWMRSKPVDIGHTVRRGIIHFRHTGIPEVPLSEYDGGNGVCMRTLPIALVTLGETPSKIQQLSRIHAHITHNNPLSDAGTESIIHMIQCALRGGTLADVEILARNLTESYPLFNYLCRRRENPSGFIVETLQAVFQSLFDYPGFERTMIDVVNRGGDADTTGAILGMVAGALYGLSSIPIQWQESLEQGVYKECLSQAEMLLEMSPYCRNEYL